jgi:hypothetical protein
LADPDELLDVEDDESDERPDPASASAVPARAIPPKAARPNVARAAVLAMRFLNI